MKSKVLAIIEQASKPLSSNDVVELSGLEKKVVDKAIKDLKDEGRLFSPKRCYYSINQ